MQRHKISHLFFYREYSKITATLFDTPLKNSCLHGYSVIKLRGALELIDLLQTDSNFYLRWFQYEIVL